MKRVDWQGSAWWVDPKLWRNGFENEVERPTESLAVGNVFKQACIQRRPLLRVIVTLERWYHDMHPEVIPFVRLQLIARRLDMTIDQVDTALHEANGLFEVGLL